MEDRELIPASEFCFHNEIEISFIHSLQEYGLVEVIHTEESEFLHANELSEIEKMMHLHYDLNVNIEGIDVITHLLKRIEQMQNELMHLSGKFHPVEDENSSKK